MFTGPRERAWAARHPLRAKALQALGNAKQRAKQAGVPFDLTLDHVNALFAGSCAVAGIPFSLESGSPWAPSLDRIIPSQGYTPSNTRAVVWIYNAAKNKSADADVLTLAAHLLKRNP